MNWRRTCWRKRLLSTRTTVRRSACLRQVIHSAPIWAGRKWQDVPDIAERTALAAIRADSEDPWAHHALGAFYLITRRFDDSLAEFELALRLNPSFLQAQNYYATALSFCGRWEESLEAVSRAIQLSPRDPFSALYYGSASSPNTSEAITKKRCDWRELPFAFAPTTPPRTVSWRLPPGCQATARPPQAH